MVLVTTQKSIFSVQTYNLIRSNISDSIGYTHIIQVSVLTTELI